MEKNNHLACWEWFLLLFLGIIFGGFADFFALTGNEISQSVFGFPALTIVTSALVLGLYALYVKFVEKHEPTDLKLNKLIPHTLLGLLVGAIYMILVVCSIAASGCATVSMSDFSLKEQFGVIMLFLAVAVGEEIICRGIIFRLIDQRWNTWAALIFSALFFGFGHISNDNATCWSSIAIAIEAGLLLGAAYKWSGTLWVPIGIHWAWNYVQGNVFGLAVSGGDTGDAILATTVNGPDIITGGAFGPEASIIAVIFGILFTIVFLFNRYRH